LSGLAAQIINHTAVRMKKLCDVSGGSGMAVHGNGLITQMGQVGRTHRTRGEGKAMEIQLHGVIGLPNEQNRSTTLLNTNRIFCPRAKDEIVQWE
jgi:hypothetical protein